MHNTEIETKVQLGALPLVGYPRIVLVNRYIY